MIRRWALELSGFCGLSLMLAALFVHFIDTECVK